VQGVGFVRSLAQPTAVQLPAQQSCATAANRRFASKQPFDLQAIDGRGCLLRKAEQGTRWTNFNWCARFSGN